MISLTPAIQAWINMLQTTTLPQTTATFHDEHGAYCALGVFCLANGQPALQRDGTGNWNFVHEHMSIPAAWNVWFKNDAEHKTFKELAKWAEVYFSDPHTRASPDASGHVSDPSSGPEQETLMSVIDPRPSEPLINSLAPTFADGDNKQPPAEKPIPMPPPAPPAEEVYDDDDLVEDDSDNDSEDDE